MFSRPNNLQFAYQRVLRGSLKKMEGLYQTILSKRMDLQSSNLAAMFKAYVKFGVFDKMEMFYRRIHHSKTNMKEDLIRTLALVYIYRIILIED